MSIRLSATIPTEVEPTCFDRFIELFQLIGAQSVQAFWRYRVPEDPRSLRNHTAHAGLPIDSVHGSFGAELDLTSPDPNVRAQTLLAHEHDGELAAALGGPFVVVHPSCLVPENPGFDLNERDEWGPAIENERMPLLHEALEHLASIGEEFEVVYLIENVPGSLWIGNDAAQLASLVREVNSPFVRMCFDLGHANIESGRFGPVHRQLANCLDVIRYLHVNDNDGADDSHLPPGDGTIDWHEIEAVLADAPHDLTAVLEMFDPIDRLETLIGHTEMRDRLARVFHLQVD